MTRRGKFAGRRDRGGEPSGATDPPNQPTPRWPRVVLVVVCLAIGAVVLERLSRPREEVPPQPAPEGSVPADASPSVARLTLQGLLAEARQLAAELETLPDSAEALNLAGSIYEYVHETQKAVDCWERTLKIRPDSPEVHFNLGFVARQAGEFEKAESHFLKSYAISPDLGDLRYYLADSQLNLGEADDAIATLEGAKDLNRFGAKGRCVLGRAYAQRGDFRKARENFEAALVMNPELVEAHFGLSKALTRLGEPEKAKKHGDAAAALQRTEQRGLEAYRPGEVAEIASDAGSVRRRLAVFCRSGAEVYFRLGRNAQAEPLLRRAAALSVESPESSRSNEKGPPPAPAL